MNGEVRTLVDNYQDVYSEVSCFAISQHTCPVIEIDNCNITLCFLKSYSYVHLHKYLYSQQIQLYETSGTLEFKNTSEVINPRVPNPWAVADYQAAACLKPGHRRDTCVKLHLCKWRSSMCVTLQESMCSCHRHKWSCDHVYLPFTCCPCTGPGHQLERLGTADVIHFNHFNLLLKHSLIEKNVSSKLDSKKEIKCFNFCSNCMHLKFFSQNFVKVKNSFNLHNILTRPAKTHKTSQN